MSSNSILNIKKDGEWIEIPALKGEDGFSPTATVEKVGKVATITITDINGTTTATIADGTGSGGSGEENTIESISVNGTPISVDENKNVDITVPKVTNDLTDELKSSYDDAVTAKHTHDNKTVLDGITAEKVEAWDKAEENVQSDWNETDDTADGFIKNKPTIPSLDGYAKTSEIPSKVSELTNDSNYQTAEQVNSTVATEIAKVVADAPEDLNTLKEMSDWIAGHEDDASAMNSAIQKNKTDIATLQTDKVDKETGKSLLADTDKSNYDDAVSKVHTHDNKSILDGITSDKVSEWDNKSEFSGSYNDLSDKPTIPKGDGTTITIDEDGTLHGSAQVDEMTGATADKDGTSGTVPAPTAGQGNLFLRGDGTWAEAKQDLSAYYNNADYTNNKLQLKHDDKVLKEFEIKGSGGATITPKPTVNPQIKNDDKKVVITWEDPTNTVIEGSTFSTWAGTKLVMKESGYPTSPDDGTLLVDNTTRDKYKTTGFEKSGLTNDKQYYFALFPYSTDGVYNYDSGNRLLGEPTEGLKIVTFAGGTDAEIAKMIQAHYNNKINIADYWAVGDTRPVSLSAMSATGVGESHRAQTVQFVIGDFEHDDLATPINGHSKAAVTLLQKDCLMDASNASNPVNGSGNTENGYMNSTDTNVGGWKNCARRTWCNNVFFAALPSAWQSMVKTVNKKSCTGGGSSSGTEVTADKIFLAAEIEILGLRKYSVDGEGTQYQYYKNAKANIYKMPKWNSSYVSNVYFERSPRSGYSAYFCAVGTGGNAGHNTATTAFGVAPCLCI